MYRSCIFCSAELGANEALESFPVGRQIAFDAWKGRLWAVCPVCGRWNLAPIEERWETVEAAEKLYRDARLRVQSENVGLARLPDGTRFVRVGGAVPGELAAWRYGTQLLRRRKRYLITGALSAGATVAFWGGLQATGVGIAGLMGVSRWWENRRQRRIVYRIPDRADSGAGLVIRRFHVDGMHLDAGWTGNLEVHIRDAHRDKPSAWSGNVRKASTDIAVVAGASARGLLARAMVHVNKSGATRAKLNEADRLLAQMGSAEEVLRRAAAGGAALGRHAGSDPRVLKGPESLVFEMALNEESERRALEGELAALEAAWREAEEIAAIADALPGSIALDRLLDRLSR
ncbi:MAG TPA: hypothetical protein VFZ24_18510 [Longimicrobiales bacterium]